MASTPISLSSTASETVWIPLIISLPFQTERNHLTSSKVTAGSNTFAAISDNGLLKFLKVANSNGAVVSRLAHHFGFSAISKNVFKPIFGGTVKPFRISRHLIPPTAVSTVSIKPSKPAACASSINFKL